MKQQAYVSFVSPKKKFFLNINKCDSADFINNFNTNKKQFYLNVKSCIKFVIKKKVGWSFSNNVCTTYSFRVGEGRKTITTKTMKILKTAIKYCRKNTCTCNFDMPVCLFVCLHDCLCLNVINKLQAINCLRLFVVFCKLFFVLFG